MTDKDDAARQDAAYRRRNVEGRYRKPRVARPIRRAPRDARRSDRLETTAADSPPENTDGPRAERRSR